MTSYLWSSLWSNTCLPLTFPLIPVSIPFSHPRPHWLPLSTRACWIYSCLRDKLALPFIWNTLPSGFCMSMSLSFRSHLKHYILRKVISNLTNCTSLLLFQGDIHHMTLVYFIFIELILNHIVKSFPWLSTVPSPYTIKLHGKGDSSIYPLLSSA